MFAVCPLCGTLKRLWLQESRKPNVTLVQEDTSFPRSCSQLPEGFCGVCAATEEFITSVNDYRTTFLIASVESLEDGPQELSLLHGQGLSPSLPSPACHFVPPDSAEADFLLFSRLRSLRFPPRGQPQNRRPKPDTNTSAQETCEPRRALGKAVPRCGVKDANRRYAGEFLFLFVRFARAHTAG